MEVREDEQEKKSLHTPRFLMKMSTPEFQI